MLTLLSTKRQFMPFAHFQLKQQQKTKQMSSDAEDMEGLAESTGHMQIKFLHKHYTEKTGIRCLL